MSQRDWLASPESDLTAIPSGEDSQGWRESMCCYKGAEFLVAADLSLAGYLCSLAAEGLPYDLVADDGCRLYTVQVKSSSVLRSGYSANAMDRYEFGILRRGGHTKEAEERQKGRYQLVDVFALVALDRRMVLYRSANHVPRNIRIRSAKFTVDMRDISRREAFRCR